MGETMAALQQTLQDVQMGCPVSSVKQCNVWGKLQFESSTMQGRSGAACRCQAVRCNLVRRTASMV